MSERRRPAAPIWAKVVLYATLLALYLPTVVMFINSFLVTQPFSDTATLTFTFDWYRAVFNDQELMRALARSLLVGLGAACVATCIGGLASVAVLRSTFKFSVGLEKLTYLSLVLPELVFALSLLTWFYILHIQLSLVTVMIAHITFSLSFVMMTVNGRLVTIDRSLEDAARDLGASEWQIFFKIIAPILMPAFISGFLLSFLLSFDDFLITFFTIGMGMDTLPIKLYASMKSGLTPKLSALATLMFMMTLTLITILIKVRGMRTFVENKQ